MKSTIKLNLFKIRGSSQEFDDRPDYEYPVEVIEITYSHILINKKTRLRKAAIKYAKSICRWPYIIILTDKSSMKNIVKVQDGFTVDIYGKVFIGNKHFLQKLPKNYGN
jgi:hypothetical protein